MGPFLDQNGSDYLTKTVSIILSPELFVICHSHFPLS